MTRRRPPQFGGPPREASSRPTERRRWRSYGDYPLPTAAEALAAPLSAFPSWFIRMECSRCGRDRVINQVHLPAICRT